MSRRRTTRPPKDESPQFRSADELLQWQMRQPRAVDVNQHKQEDAAQRLSSILTILAGIATVLAVLGSFTVYIWTTSRNVATVPYVDDSFKAAMKHSDEKAAEVLKQAFDHADANRAATLQEVKDINAANRENMARVQTSLENVVDSLRELKQDRPLPRRRDR